MTQRRFANDDIRMCLIRDNETIKSAVKERMEFMGLKISHLAKIAGIAPYRLGQYLNNRETLRSYITQYHLMKICELLGIEIEIKVNIKE